MLRFGSILKRLASPSDRELLDRSPTLGTRLRVLGRVGLRFWWAYLLLLFTSSLATLSAGMDVYHRTEQPQFCGACHEMSNNFASWNESRHKNISCADCHAGPGLGGWLAAKAGGVSQLWVHFSADSIDDIEVREDQRHTIDANCQRCHSGLARVGERFGLGVSHRQHLDKGLLCVTCHNGSFTHPERHGPPTAEVDGPAEATKSGDGAEKEDGEQDDAGKEATDAPTVDPHAAGDLEGERFVDVDACYECHDGETQVADVVAFSAADETHCQKCHPDADQALAHGARHPSSAKRKPCLDCHEATSGQSHFTVGKVAPMCDKCHTREEHASTHTPYSQGECDECHSVMSPAYLFKSGPRPTNASCLGCHDLMAELLAAKETEDLSGFADGTVDLHRLHAKELEPEGNDWCLSCHASHFSDAMRGLVALRPTDEGEPPGRAKLVMYAGGSCQGGCHQSRASYRGPE